MDTAGAGQTTTYTYDKNGNALTVEDGLSHTTTRTFDALNRLSTSTDATSGVTTTTYDAHDRPLSVTDPNGNATSYVYDGFGDVIQQTSPDTGTTVYHYDSDGNLTSKTDAASVVTNQTFDALDRILTTAYPADSSENVAYTYDQTGTGYSFGIGRLTSLTDAAGSLTRDYDERGNILKDKRTSGSTVLTTQYSYDPASRVASITYPSGAVVTYDRDSAGQVWQMPFSASGADASYVGWFAHLPFGQINSINYNNGDLGRFSFDDDYRLTGLEYETYTSTPYLHWTYAYDAANNVTSITDDITSGNSQSFGYDALNRLTSASSSGTYGSLGYTYDHVGNLTASTAGSTSYSYSLTSGTNRLASVAWTGNSESLSYTSTGNISAIVLNSTTTFSGTYNKANRLAAVADVSPAISGEVYDWQGRRFSKTDSGSSASLYTYDLSGHLLEENNGGTVTDYIYVDGTPIANWEPGESHLYFTDTDRLGTPLVSRDLYGLPNWAAYSAPYGAMTNTVSTGTWTGPVTENLRLPGQHADSETGFYYNGFRDYMPGIGRYLESDPIGLAGGLNTYAYAGGNPIKYVDPDGRNPWLIIATGAGFIGGAIVGAITSQPGHRWEGAAVGGAAAAATVYFAPRIIGTYIAAAAGYGESAQVIAGTVGSAATVGNGIALGTAGVNYVNDRSWDTDLRTAELYGFGAELLSLDLPISSLGGMALVAQKDAAFSSMLASLLGTTAGIMDQLWQNIQDTGKGQTCPTQ